MKKRILFLLIITTLFSSCYRYIPIPYDTNSLKKDDCAILFCSEVTISSIDDKPFYYSQEKQPISLSPGKHKFTLNYTHIIPGVFECDFPYFETNYYTFNKGKTYLLSPGLYSETQIAPYRGHIKTCAEWHKIFSNKIVFSEYRPPMTQEGKVISYRILLWSSLGLLAFILYGILVIP